MNYDEVLGLVRDVAVQFQKMQVLGMQGKNKESGEAFRELVTLGIKCLEKNLSFCFFLKRKMPMPDGQYFAATHPLNNNWPVGGEGEEQRHAEGTIHVHVTFVYSILWAGHIETHPEGFDVDFVTFPNHISPHSSSEPRHGDPTKEGGLLSPEEMKRFLRDQGLADLDNR